MAHQPTRSFQSWTNEEIDRPRRLARAEVPVTVIARRLGRSVDSVRDRARFNGIPLEAVRRRPRSQTGDPE